jgi:hypothetical protein
MDRYTSGLRTGLASGVPEGSVLVQILFLIYINHMDDGINSKILKFADDTKIYRKLETDSDIVQLQHDLTNTFKWSRDWLKVFIVESVKSCTLAIITSRHHT